MQENKSGCFFLNIVYYGIWYVRVTRYICTTLQSSVTDERLFNPL